MPSHPGSELPSLLRSVIRQAQSPTREYASVTEWWEVFRDAAVGWAAHIDQAFVGGVLVDRVGYAFAGGYQAAIRRLIPSLPHDCLASFSVTEEGGGHPRAVKATLRPAAPDADPAHSPWILCGHKRWATLSCEGDVLFVVASTGKDPDGRNCLRVARVDRHTPGVTVNPMPPTPFAPEISHGELHFDNVSVAPEAILPGDGYADYVKPFRTIEDTHVTAAILGYLVRVAFASRWPSSIQEELLNLVASLRGIGTSDPSEPAIHVALGGFFTAYRRCLESATPHWDRVAPEVRARWKRDWGLANVAAKVRTKRLETAWKKVREGQGH